MTGRRKRDEKFIASYFSSIFQIQSLRKLQISLCNATQAQEHAVGLSLAGWWCCCKQAFGASLLLHSILLTARRDNLPFPLLEGTFTFPLLYLPLLRPSFLLDFPSISLSLAPSSPCCGVIFPQKPFQGSFVKAAQNMNFTWVAHSLLSMRPMTTAGELFPHSPTHKHKQSPRWRKYTQPSVTSEVHESTNTASLSQKKKKKNLLDEYWSMQHIQNTDEMPQIKDVLMAAWCFIDHKPC